MNPVLLKPGSDRRSHVVVMGQPAGSLDARDFIDGRGHLRGAAYAAFDDLASRFDVVVAEGAGSPAEINLRAGDYVNMGLARHAELPTVVVGDIDRGGVFAAMYGTVALLDAGGPGADGRLRGQQVPRRRVAAAARARRAASGSPAAACTACCPGTPTCGSTREDALDLAGRRAAAGGQRLRGRRRPAAADQQLHRRRRARPRAGTSTSSSPPTRARCRRRPGGAARHPRDARRPRLAAGPRARPGGPEPRRRRRPVLGICGGFQMLGRTIGDPDGVEGTPGAEVDGLGLLDVDARLRAGEGAALAGRRGARRAGGGYEIHHGRVSVGAGRGVPRRGARTGSVFGTMWHGSLEDDEFRARVPRRGRAVAGRGRRPASASRRARSAGSTCSADLVEEHLDVDAL